MVGNKLSRVILQRLALLLVIIVFISTQQAAAFTQNDANCAVQGGVSGTCFYDPSCAADSSQTTNTTSGSSSSSSSNCSCPTAADSSTAAAVGGGSNGSWKSGLQPPYILEEWAIEVLKDLAAKKNVDPTKAVTSEHVTALIAFAIGEGGDIANPNLYNPLNSGIDATELIQGAHDPSGNQSFKSFDDGVEAAARTFALSNYSHLAGNLIDPSITAKQFMHTLAFSWSFPGNSEWAGASNPSDPQYDPNYYPKHLAYVDQVKAGYKDIASIVIGTPAYEQSAHINDKSKLNPSLSVGVAGTGAGGTPSNSGCGNVAQCSQQAGIANSGSTIVIDPGHGPIKTTVDAQTGLNMIESHNAPEIYDVWDVARQVKSSLETAGYKVILTKNSVEDNVTFRERANVADNNHAALALSIHGDSGLPDPGEIFVQKDGLYRGTGSNRTVFNDGAVAQKSQQYAQIFQQERQKTQGESVVVKDNVFGVRSPGFEPGNIPMVQLFSHTPWVYNEQKMPFDKTSYAQSLVNSVEKAIPLSPSQSANGATPPVSNGSQNTSGTCAATGSVAAAVELAMKYAWPDGRKVSSINQATQAYQDATNKAVANKEYVGGCTGVDCGAFVTRVMRDSGADPNYNWGPKDSRQGNTLAQQAYLEANSSGPNAKYQKIGTVTSTKDLQPGDIAIVNGSAAEHTYLYVGPESNHPSFHGDAAAASQCGYAPTANVTYFSEGVDTFVWYRLIKAN